MTLELVPWRGAKVPLLGGDEIARYTTQDYINWITQNQMYTGQPPIQTTYGSRPAEPISYSFQGFVEGALYADTPVAAAEQYRLRVFGQAPLLYQEVIDGRAGDFFDDKNLERIREPWPGATLSDLMKRTLIYGDFAGNGFVVDIDDELVLIRPDWVEIILEKRMYRNFQLGWKQVGIIYYEGGLRSGDGVPFLPGEYAHFIPGLPDPLASYRGMSWLTPLIREVQADKSASAHKLAFFENAASPNLAVSLPKEITPTQFSEFVEAMDAKHKGAANAYKTLYTAGGADVTVIGANMQQMDFSAVQGKGETRIANAAGVPPTLLSFSEGMQGSSLNAGNYTAAKRNFVDTTMRDLWQNFASSIAHMDYFRAPMPNSRLWYDGRDIPFLHEDAKDLAEIQQTRSATINAYITNGWVPDTAVAAVSQDDISLLKHSGALSVQLQAPGAQDTNGDGQPDDFAAPPELQNFDFGSLREGVGNTGTDQPASGEAQRARWDLRYGKGNKGGGKFRSLSDAVTPILKDWASGKGERDPLEQFQPRQLRTMAKQMADEARKAGEHQRASMLTLGPKASKPELKKALYADAMFENTGTRPSFAEPKKPTTRISDAKAAMETRPRQRSDRELSFDDALDAGDFDAAMDAAVTDFRERHGRDMTPDELDRTERNIDAAIGRREKKKPPQPAGQPGPSGPPITGPEAADYFRGPDGPKAQPSERDTAFNDALDAGDREAAIQAALDALEARTGKPATAKDRAQIEKNVDAAIGGPKGGEADQAQVAKIAGAFHEDWRKTRLQPDGTYEPRVKKTKDQAWIDAHGTDDVDIANTSYDDLPNDWKAENKAAAEVVESILRERGGKVDLSDEATRLEVGEEIHKAWLDRNSWAAGGELDVPFADLPADEQAKDLDQLTVAMGVAAPKAPGGRYTPTEAEQAYERAVAIDDQFGAVQARVDDFREQYGRSPDPEEYRDLQDQVTRDFDRRRRNQANGGPTFARADFGAMRADLDATEGEIERAFNVNQLRFKAGSSEGGRWRSMSDFAADVLKKWIGHEGSDDPLGEHDFNERQLRTIIKDFRGAAEAAGDGDRAKRLTPPRMASSLSEQQRVDQLKAVLYKDTRASVGGARDSGVRAPEAPVKAAKKAAPRKAAKTAGMPVADTPMFDERDRALLSMAANGFVESDIRHPVLPTRLVNNLVNAQPRLAVSQGGVHSGSRRIELTPAGRERVSELLATLPSSDGPAGRDHDTELAAATARWRELGFARQARAVESAETRDERIAALRDLMDTLIARPYASDDESERTARLWSSEVAWRQVEGDRPLAPLPSSAPSSAPRKATPAKRAPRAAKPADLNSNDLALLRNASDGTTKNLGSSQGGRDRNEQIDRLVATGYLRQEGDRYVLTEKGRQATGGRGPLAERSEGLDPEDIERRRPYPGQKYKHGWIPIGPHEQWHGQDLGELQELADAVKSGETGRFKLSGGTMGDVFLVDHGNGAETIEKRLGDVAGTMGPNFPPELQADAEQLASTLGRAIDAPVPRVLRTAPDKVTMDVIYGDTWFDLEQEAFATGDPQDRATAKALMFKLTGTNEGIRLGVLDILTDNWDRGNSRNWKVDDDTKRPVGYDHAFVWSGLGVADADHAPEPGDASPFAQSFIRFQQGHHHWADNPLTQDDIAFLRERLAAVEGDFDRLGRHDWWEFAQTRLEAIARHATGTESIFA